MYGSQVITRRAWLRLAAGGAVGGAVLASTAGTVLGLAPEPTGPTGLAGLTDATVYKSPTCGCCAKWVDHLKAHRFRVTVHDLPDLTELKAKHGVPDALQSCHTALVAGYVVEGHVPADVIQQLLKERPKVAGLAVPGMPMGSPGMEGARRDRYEVLAFTRAGETRVYARR